ncbi:fused MFS/spermidine synthase [Lujinxingia litoralis]|uniref:fused MFS/spermidine synthase n=1 Tax=Lujinxingia litoralis TaxID=2211119 RepID=UPI0011B94A31|nr:fused MFS/spermidine synthase [Lujinxingia litoralis]
MVVLFTLTIFLSALLLFVVQPMAGKMLLPFLGGTPGVWNTCMMFFQAVLLGGYLWAHGLQRLRPRRQLVLHGGLLLAALLALPLSMTRMDLSSPLLSSYPNLWLLAALGLGVGLPFLALSTTSPLIQAWFARLDHRRSRDPYFLYAASNAGSLLALVGFPLLVEPIFGVRAQASLWSGAFALLVALLVGCGVLTLRGGAQTRDVEVGAPDGEDGQVAPTRASVPGPDARSRGRWVLYAFVPSSLMLGVTSYISTDVAAFPLLWVIPLALYTGSFILVFSSLRLSLALMGRVMSLVGVALLVAWIMGATHPAWLLLPLHIVFFGLAALVIHGRLARARPAASHLTSFYLHMSIGGLLGGIFNSLLAPMIFDRIWEYPLVMILACALRPQSEAERADPDRRWKRAAPVAATLLMLATMGALRIFDITITQISAVLLFGIPAAIAYSQVERPRRLALGLLGVLAASTFFPGIAGNVIFKERTFFGTVQIAESAAHYRMVHGGTVHGQVLKEDPGCTPLAYYHRQGPMGGLFELYHSSELPRRVGVIGLGLGSHACYARSEDEMTFYELDPTVIEVAKRYGPLKRSPAGALDFVVGDARIQLQQSDAEPYGLLIVDAFSSDAIPVHLLTVEAFALYVSRMERGGLLAVHISNRYFDLLPVLRRQAREQGIHLRVLDDAPGAEIDVNAARQPSTWVVLTEDRLAIEELERLDPRWARSEGREVLWTDDHANVLNAWRR